MSTIDLATLREMRSQNKIPSTLNIENTSNMNAAGERSGPISKVVISINGSNGKERIVVIDATIATTDLLDQATFAEIMDSPQFAANVRKGLIRIVTKETAEKINTSEKAIKNLSNRAKLRGEQPVKVDTVGSGPIKKLVSNWLSGEAKESDVLEALDNESIAFTKSDLTDALSIITDPSSDVYSTITEKLSDFEVS